MKPKNWMIPVAEKTRDKLIRRRSRTEQLMIKILQKNGIRFEFQKIIYGQNRFYVVDFVCLSSCGRRVIIELDGQEHWEVKARKNDKNRSSTIRRQGYRVIRIPNFVVNRSEAEVLAKLRQYNINK